MICKTDGSCGIKGKGRGLFGDDCEHQSDCFEKLLCINAKCDQVNKILFSITVTHIFDVPKKIMCLNKMITTQT
jgi:hypothetical protein